MLKDSFYFGMAHSKTYGRYPHIYAPLTQQWVWDNCQDVLAGRRKRRKERSHAYALKGLVVCGSCGCLYSPETHKGHVYYSCTNAKRTCKRIYAREDTLLAPIHTILEAFEQIPRQVQDGLVNELRVASDADATFHHREVSRRRTEYDRFQKRKEALLDIYLDGGVSESDYEAKLYQIAAAQSRLNIAIEHHANGNHEYDKHVAAVISLCRRLNGLFKRSEPDQKSLLLKSLVQNASAKGKEVEFKLKKPFDAVLELAHHPTGLPDLAKFRTPEWKTVCEEFTRSSTPQCARLRSS